MESAASTSRCRNRCRRLTSTTALHAKAHAEPSNAQAIFEFDRNYNPADFGFNRVDKAMKERERKP